MAQDVIRSLESCSSDIKETATLMDAAVNEIKHWRRMYYDLASRYLVYVFIADADGDKIAVQTKISDSCARVFEALHMEYPDEVRLSLSNGAKLRVSDSDFMRRQLAEYGMQVAYGIEITQRFSDLARPKGDGA